MAIFYGHIKGFSGDEENGKKWIKIEFKDDNSPMLYLADTKANLENDRSRTKLGSIVTTDKSYNFSQQQSFKDITVDNVTVDNVSSNNDSVFIKSNVYIPDNYNFIGYDYNNDGSSINKKEYKWSLTSSSFQMVGDLEIGPNIFINGGSTFKVNKNDGSVTAGTITASGNITTSATIEANGQITGSSFNATSDRRAKTNIYTYNQPVLGLLCNWHLYTFNYTNTDSSERQIGIIAQEHLNDNKSLLFDIVENKNASGANNDYMHVKESKLVYLAIKAIQELAEENRKLKQEIEEIKKGLL